MTTALEFAAFYLLTAGGYLALVVWLTRAPRCPVCGEGPPPAEVWWSAHRARCGRPTHIVVPEERR